MFASQFGRSQWELIESLKIISSFFTHFSVYLSCCLNNKTYIGRHTHIHSLWFCSFILHPAIALQNTLCLHPPLATDLTHSLRKRNTQGPAVFFVHQSHNRIPWLMKAAAAVGISSAIITASRNWTSLLVSPVFCLSHLRQSFKAVGDYAFILPEAIRTNMKSVLSKEFSPAFVKSAGEVALVSHCFLFVFSAWTSAWSARKCFH